MRALGAAIEPPSAVNPATSWFLPTRIKVVLLVVAGLFACVWLLWLALLGEAFGDADTRVDFHDVWAAASLAAGGEASAAYDDARLEAEQQGLPGSERGFFKWLYPPPFFLFVIPLGLLPVLPAFAAWVTITACLALSAVRRIAGQWMVIVAVVVPATFFNFLIGQNGMLTAGLFAWGMLLLRDRPVLAGAVLGLMTYKPQFFPLVMLALLAGRQWHAAIAACASALSIALVSLVAFGPGTWEAFFDTATNAGRDVYRDGGFVQLEKMASVSAMMRLAGASGAASQVAQLVAGVLGAVAVAVLWRRNAAPEYRFAGLALGVLLATPYLYHYDLTLLAFAVLWIGVRLQADGRLAAWHWVLFAVALALPILGTAVAQQAGLVIGPMVVVAMLTLVCREGLKAKSSCSHLAEISFVPR